MSEIRRPAAFSSAARIVAGNLRVDAGAAEVLRAFEGAGIQSLLVKGASTVRWLYDPDSPRPYVDCDLLIRPADVAAARRVLSELGFEPQLQAEEMPAWWQEHAVEWRRSQDGIVIDLHRSLPGVGADPEDVWLALAADAEELEVADFPARAPAIPARAFHLALHAAQHGPKFGGPSAPDLERAIAAADTDVWRRAAALAARLDATAPFATGLRRVPSGQALAAALDLPEDQPVDVLLRAGTAPPVALGFDQLQRAGGLRQRVAIVGRKLIPPPTFMRAWHPLASRGRLGLLLAYLWRPLWVLRHTPRGFRAWRAARRRAGG